ncbi:hypothetical protein V491_08670, partial [Pseudogymnoascus sp. VKM F-3775]
MNQPDRVALDQFALFSLPAGAAPAQLSLPLLSPNKYRLTTPRVRWVAEPYDIDDETWRYRDQRIPPSTELLFDRYEQEWHPKAGERFLTHREFTNLSLDLNTTKITTIHDEGMRRLREAAKKREYTTRSADLYRPLAALSYTDPYRPSATLSTDLYGPSESRSTSSLDCHVSSRSSTPQPRVKRSSAAVYDPNQPPAPPRGTP